MKRMLLLLAVLASLAVATPVLADTYVTQTSDPAVASSCQTVVGHTFANPSWVLIYQDGVCVRAVDPITGMDLR